MRYLRDLPRREPSHFNFDYRIYTKSFIDMYCNTVQRMTSYKVVEKKPVVVEFIRREQIPFELYIIEAVIPIGTINGKGTKVLRVAGIKINDICKIFHVKNRYMPIFERKDKEVFNKILKTLDDDKPPKVLGIENYYFEKSIAHVGSINDYGNMILILADYQECFNGTPFPENHVALFDNVETDDIKNIIDFYRFRKTKQAVDTKIIFTEPKTIMEIGEIYHKTCPYYNKIKNYVNRKGLVFNKEKEYVYETVEAFSDRLNCWRHNRDKRTFINDKIRDFVVNTKIREWDPDRNGIVFFDIYQSAFIKYEVDFSGNKHFESDWSFSQKFKNVRKRNVRNLLKSEIEGIEDFDIMYQEDEFCM